MSRSRLRNRYMKGIHSEKGKRNLHRLDEAPKNRPSRFITSRCDFCKISWLQEPGSFGGHKVRHQGHRMVSGIVRQKVKEEVRQEINEYIEN